MSKKAIMFGQEWETVSMTVSEEKHAAIKAWLEASYSLGEEYWFGRTGKTDFDEAGEKSHEYQYYFTDPGMVSMMTIKFFAEKQP